jgi:hypothetical protein
LPILNADVSESLGAGPRREPRSIKGHGAGSNDGTMAMNATRPDTRNPRRRTAGLAVAMAAAALAWTGPAGAEVLDYTWTMSGSYGPFHYGNELVFGANEDPAVKLKVRSYSAANTNANFYEAYTDLFSGGVGVQNRFERGGSPNLAIDNKGHDDYVLMEFESDDFTVDAFRIGWRYRDSDIRVWVGGAGSGLNLAAHCGGSACKVSDLASLGFTQLPDFWNVVPGSATGTGTTLTGRYMILAAGDEGHKHDYFKLQHIAAQQSVNDPPPPGAPPVPEPPTLAVLAVGLAGLAFLNRRRAGRKKLTYTGH